jgi:hypothetical protein
MDASDLLRQIRNRVQYRGKLATREKPHNKTLQTDSQTLINLKLGPREVYFKDIVALPACDCPEVQWIVYANKQMYTSKDMETWDSSPSIVDEEGCTVCDLSNKVVYKTLDFESWTTSEL